MLRFGYDGTDVGFLAEAARLEAWKQRGYAMIASSEMQETSRARSATDAIRSDHRALSACAGHLDREISMLASGAGSNDGQVRFLLEEFRRRLLSHLDAEERSAILERAASHEPRFARRVAELRLQHEELRRIVTELATAAPAAAVEASWSEFRARFGAFRQTLDEHERGENEILQSAYLDDLGGRG